MSGHNGQNTVRRPAPFIPAQLRSRSSSQVLRRTPPPTDPAAAAWAQHCLLALNARTTQIIVAAGPSAAEDAFKKRVQSFLVAFLTNDFSQFPECAHLAAADWPTDVSVAPYGSFLVKTYLSGCDLDLVAFTNADSETFVRQVHARLAAASGTPFTISEPILVNSAVPVCKLLVDGVRIDISVNQSQGPLSALLLEKCDLVAGSEPHLYKSTVILAKAWAQNEAHVLGSHHFLLSSYAISTIVMHIFARYPHISSPLHGFCLFIEFIAAYFGSGQCYTHAVAVQNLVPVRALATAPAEDALLAAGVMPQYLNSSLRQAVQAAGAGAASVLSKNDDIFFPIRCVNIVDPLRPANNLGRAVSSLSLARIARAAQLAALQVRAAVLPAVFGRARSVAGSVALLDAMFVNTLTRAKAKARGQVHVGPGLVCSFYGSPVLGKPPVADRPQGSSEPCLPPQLGDPDPAPTTQTRTTDDSVLCGDLAEIEQAVAAVHSFVHGEHAAGGAAHRADLGDEPATRPSADAAGIGSLDAVLTDSAAAAAAASSFSFAQPMPISPDLNNRPRPRPRPRPRTHARPPSPPVSSQPSEIVSLFPPPQTNR